MQPIPGTHYHPNYAVGIYHWSETFQPPSMPPGTRSELFLSTPRLQPSSDLENVHPPSDSMGDIGSFALNFQSALPNPNFEPLGPICRSPSPDIRDVLVDDGSDKVEPPVLINMPQLSGALAFTLEALRSWGHAHMDHSEQTIQFWTQLRKWKSTKQELHKVLSKAYEDTCLLKEHVVSNEVTQEHLYVLHIQVKWTAKQI